MYVEPMRFTATLVRYPGLGGWTFAPVPERFAPPVTHGWGRTPVRAVVDGQAWETSVWRDRSGKTLLPVPKRIRGGKEHGDTVTVELAPPGTRGPEGPADQVAAKRRARTRK